MRFLAPAIALLCLAPAAARAEVFEAGPSDDVESMIGALAAGDELVLADGTYTMTERFSFDITGTEASPIVIRAATERRRTSTGRTRARTSGTSARPGW